MMSGLGLVPSGPWIGRTRTAELADCYSTFMNELLAQRAVRCSKLRFHALVLNNLLKGFK